MRTDSLVTQRDLFVMSACIASGTKIEYSVFNTFVLFSCKNDPYTGICHEDVSVVSLIHVTKALPRTCLTLMFL